MAQPTALQDAEKLNSAILKGDKKTIIDILGNRSNEQRIAIGKRYEEIYQKTLDEAISEAGRVGLNFRRTVAALLKTPVDIAVDELHNALRGRGADEGALIEILCTKEPAEIKQIKEAYKLKYKADLGKELDDETAGEFRRVLREILDPRRGEAAATNPHRDAQDIYDAGEDIYGTDETVIIHIIARRSFWNIRAINEEYGKISERSLCDALRSELSGNLLESLLTIVQSANCPSTYFAQRLSKTFKKYGTHDRTVIRLIVSRSEIDMCKVVEAYLKIDGKSLMDAIKENTSGPYRDLLLAVVEANSK